MQANLRDEASVRRAIHGVTAVVNCVGILAEGGRQTFQASRPKDPRASPASPPRRVSRLVQISAIGADEAATAPMAGPRRWARRRCQGLPRRGDPAPVDRLRRRGRVLQPFRTMARYRRCCRWSGPTPGSSRSTSTTSPRPPPRRCSRRFPGVYELGGPEVATFRDLMRRMLVVIERRRPIVALPWGLARLQAGALDLLQRWSFGLFTNGLITAIRCGCSPATTWCRPGPGASPNSASSRRRWTRSCPATSGPTARAASIRRSRPRRAACGRNRPQV
jgi:hypothetical protein